MRIAILGSGAWGTALACALAARQDVMLWARSPEHAQQLDQQRTNERYLPGVALPPSIAVTSNLPQAVRFAEQGLLAVTTPTAGLRPLLQALRELPDLPPVLWLCKGFERDSGMLPHQIVAVELPQHPCGPLSGPSFADEVARGLPTALTVAGSSDFCAQVTRAVHGDALRVYSTRDVVGVEVGGAVKNVMAIGTGIADALGLGNNARAALITRGLAETTRLGMALGGRAGTFTGLTGLGDLLLTCTGDLSRNRRVGLALGRGISLERALGELGHVAEGVWSAPATVARAREVGVDMPITEAVCAVLEGRLNPRAALERLLAREPRNESA
ncbi:MAG TPA: NAD(P)H-dependent glycerol-3-phosphate dehydrogenase [Burkholderiaceae bacterium]|nr:NAD(P)H-dependent glycerol-3-phosphate dehydrogenase [Burkholderiaceae bacterium]